MKIDHDHVAMGETSGLSSTQASVQHEPGRQHHYRLNTTKHPHSAHMLQLLRRAIPRPQIHLERPAKQLQQHLEAGLGDGRVVAAFTQLVADKGVLCPCELVPAKHDAGVAHLLANEVAAGVGDVRVLDAKDHGDFAFELGQLVERVCAVGGRGGGGVGRGVGPEGA